MKEDKNLVENKSIEDIIKENEPEKKPKRKIVWLIVFIVSLVLCICCVVFLVLNTSSCTNGESQYKKLSSQVVSPTLTDDNKPNVKKTKEKNPIDFKALNKINKDIVGWIKISDTNIDYPVLRAPESDQSFYLHRDYYKNYLYAGSIYMESYNQPDLWQMALCLLICINLKIPTFSQSTKLLRYILLRVSRHIKCIQLMNMMIDI